MDICEFCVELLAIIASTSSAEPQWTTKSVTFGKSKETCYLCKELYDHLKQESLKNIALDCEVTRQKSEMQSEQELYCHASIHFQDETIEQYEVMEFSLWAEPEEGNLASKVFINRPPILETRLQDICDTARNWLRECNSVHQDCIHTENTPLPHRVLHIDGSINNLTVRLMETNGTKGRYCTLSHCWGPVEKRPLLTVNANYEEHVQGILIDRLPKTFRETLLFARGIGIEYVWIDSLCIIQDSYEDWEVESRKMGTIYNNASLVVAAAGSTNSTEGLFVMEQVKVVLRRLPYISNGVPRGVPRGTFNMALHAEHESLPSRGPLNSRAWALQERWLARRAIFFMPGGISWKCKEYRGMLEGSSNDLGHYEDFSWLHLLDYYSEKDLTYPSDRLHALRGIITEMQKTRLDKFLFGYGVWEDELLPQLLWKQTAPINEADSLDLPSWTWAATGQRKRWCPFNYDKEFRYLTQGFKILECGSLALCTHIIESNLNFHLAPKGIVYDDGIDGENEHMETSIMPGMHGDFDYPSYIVRNDHANEEILGIAVFDRGFVHNAVCCFIASCERTNDEEESDDGSDTSNSNDSDGSNETDETSESDGSDGSYKSYEGQALTASGELDETSEPDKPNEKGVAEEMEGPSELERSSSLGSSTEKDESDSDEVSSLGKITGEIIDLQQSTSFVYWALLLERVENNSYKRVGIIMLYPRAYDLRTMELVDLEIL